MYMYTYTYLFTYTYTYTCLFHTIFADLEKLKILIGEVPYHFFHAMSTSCQESVKLKLSEAVSRLRHLSQIFTYSQDRTGPQVQYASI